MKRASLRGEPVLIRPILCRSDRPVIAPVQSASPELYAAVRVQWVKLITFAISGGAIWRTVIGVLLIALIGNGFTLLAWNPLYEQITLGVILLLAVGGDAWSRLRTT